MSACSTSTVARASSSARCVGVVAAPNSRASAESRTLGASSRVSTRRANRTVHSTGGRGHGDLAALRGGAQEADVESRVVGDQHCAAGEFEERGQHRVDLRRVAHHGRGDAGELDDLRWDAAAGVDQRGQLAEHRSAAHLHRADLGDGVDVVAVAGRAAAGRLEVDHDERGVT